LDVVAADKGFTRPLSGYHQNVTVKGLTNGGQTHFEVVIGWYFNVNTGLATYDIYSYGNPTGNTGTIQMYIEDNTYRFDFPDISEMYQCDFFIESIEVNNWHG
jgi:hypothetical protein